VLVDVLDRGARGDLVAGDDQRTPAKLLCAVDSIAKFIATSGSNTAVATAGVE
jgi:hypothetical protein